MPFCQPFLRIQFLTENWKLKPKTVLNPPANVQLMGHKNKFAGFYLIPALSQPGLKLLLVQIRMVIQCLMYGFQHIIQKICFIGRIGTVSLRPYYPIRTARRQYFTAQIGSERPKAAPGLAMAGGPSFPSIHTLMV